MSILTFPSDNDYCRTVQYASFKTCARSKNTHGHTHNVRYYRPGVIIANMACVSDFMLCTLANILYDTKIVCTVPAVEQAIIA